MSLQSLIELTERGTTSERRAAARHLAKFSAPGAIAALVACLDDVPAVMDAAAHSLIRIGGEPVARAVIPLLSHPEIRQRSVALDVLLGLGAAAGPVMVELLADSDRELRKMAAEVLAQSGYRQACPALLERLDDPDAVVRAAAAAALQGLGCPGATLALLERLRGEPEDWVRFALAGAAAQLGTPEEVAQLRRLVEGSPLAPWVEEQLNRQEQAATATEEEA